MKNCENNISFPETFTPGIWFGLSKTKMLHKAHIRRTPIGIMYLGYILNESQLIKCKDNYYYMTDEAFEREAITCSESAITLLK